MKSDQDIAALTLELQSRGTDCPLLPWLLRLVIEGKLEDGMSPALIAHHDAMSMFGLPEEMAEVDDTVSDELLSGVIVETGK